eukprot:TRINITY_DN768_c0_g2_i1.p1 TRINITY_DN768_c0_g2~~TRINITY_DN768_c0_g2_i1.p1  ORF type:complete len:187 (-),score=54.47 TRINITY_DN768_c0_g2_i1:970-1530(-)
MCCTRKQRWNHRCRGRRCAGGQLGASAPPSINISIGGGVSGGASTAPSPGYGGESRRDGGGGGGDDYGSGGSGDRSGFLQGFKMAGELLANAKQGQRAEASRAMMDEIQQTLGTLRELLLRREIAEQRIRDEAGNDQAADITAGERCMRRRHCCNVGDKVDRAINQVSQEVQGLAHQQASGMMSLA